MGKTDRQSKHTRSRESSKKGVQFWAEQKNFTGPIKRFWEQQKEVQRQGKTKIDS